jgi:HEAT repeat protein
LPIAPKSKQPAQPALVDDLSQVPEVQFEEPLAKNLSNPQMTQQISQTIAKINHANSRKMDVFMETLRDERQDLKGLPYAMGDACRIKGVRSQQFGLAVLMLRRNIQDVTAQKKTSSGTELKKELAAFEPKDAATAELFWKNYKTNILKEDWTNLEPNFERQEDVTVARIAALMQVLLPESAPMRMGLVRYLSHLSHVEATRALARLAVYSVEDDIRKAALDALKTRRERDYTDILLQGMRYPLPAVARQASEAVVKLERTDLVPQLVNLLDEPDPRAPVVKEIDKKKVSTVREVVRLNHNRNCLLCHAPADTNNSKIVPMTAAIPVPGEPPPPDGYRNPTGPDDILVRIDVTYLRQDFSMMQAVEDAHPWPTMQRFDFLVRTRELSEKEAVAYQALLAKRQPGEMTPYQRATVTALAKLTGKNAEPNTGAWRKLLGMATP